MKTFFFLITLWVFGAAAFADEVRTSWQTTIHQDPSIKVPGREAYYFYKTVPMNEVFAEPGDDLSHLRKVRVMVRLHQPPKTDEVEVLLASGERYVFAGTHGNKPEKETMRGCYEPYSQDKDHVSSKGNVPMKYSTFFYGGQALHTGEVGKDSSGCVHLNEPDARLIFDLVEKFGFSQAAICLAPNL